MKPINHFVTKSLFGAGILAVLLLAFSCTQDTASEDIGSEELNAVSIKGKKARPIKAKLEFLFDYANTAPGDIVDCGGGVLLFRNLISGNMSHLGILEPGQSDSESSSGSYFMPVSCEITAFPPALVVETVYTAVYVAANGDELHTEENVTLYFNPDNRTGTFIGTARIDKGKSTGRFQNASGSWNSVNGVFDALPDGDGASWEIEGEITY